MAYNYPFKTSEKTSIDRVWEKGTLIPGYDQNIWRRDSCGTVIKYDLHGKEQQYGWEIDHIKPSAKGGGVDLILT